MGTTLDEIRSIPPGKAMLSMAVGIVIERVGQLCEADRNDLYSLVKELPKASTPEDLEAIYESMLEILEKTSARVVQAPMPSRSRKLEKWTAHVGAAIHKLRKDRGLTQEQLAEQSGLPQSHICRLEKGQHCPSSATIDKLAAALNVAPGDIDPSR